MTGGRTSHGWSADRLLWCQYRRTLADLDVANEQVGQRRSGSNEEVVELAKWLRQHNQGLSSELKVGSCGLDVYSLWDSLYQVLSYVAKHGSAVPAGRPLNVSIGRCRVGSPRPPGSDSVGEQSRSLNKLAKRKMTMNEALTWLGIAICITQSATFS